MVIAGDNVPIGENYGFIIIENLFPDDDDLFLNIIEYLFNDFQSDIFSCSFIFQIFIFI